MRQAQRAAGRCDADLENVRTRPGAVKRKTVGREEFAGRGTLRRVTSVIGYRAQACEYTATAASCGEAWRESRGFARHERVNKSGTATVNSLSSLDETAGCLIFIQIDSRNAGNGSSRTAGGPESCGKVRRSPTERSKLARERRQGKGFAYLPTVDLRKRVGAFPAPQRAPPGTRRRADPPNARVNKSGTATVVSLSSLSETAGFCVFLHTPKTLEGYS